MIINFFKNSDLLDYEVLRPLSHIRSNWDLSYDSSGYFIEEPDSFGHAFNSLLNELENTDIPQRYHDNEDQLASYVQDKLDKEIEKIGNRWIGMEYQIILQDGGFFDFNEENLVQSAKGRIIAANNYDQFHYDDMENGHRKLLALVLSLILYHRSFNSNK
jgi:hypothetical protein